MRVFTVSDIHIDYDENLEWLRNLSRSDYTEDILILAGDVSDGIPLFIEGLTILERCFERVLYTPGNHDLWVRRNHAKNSLEKFHVIRNMAIDHGIQLEPYRTDDLAIVPLLGWYDYSFGAPGPELKNMWMDYKTCKWPDGFDEKRITSYFLSLNEPHLNISSSFTISFSHFLPRIDVMPRFIPSFRRKLYPVFGTSLLDRQVEKLDSNIHIYGHSHVNNRVRKNNRLYLNNAFGYPHETRITSKRLALVYES